MNKEQFSTQMTHEIKDKFVDYRFAETFIERGEQVLASLPPVNDEWNEEFAALVFEIFKEEGTDRFLRKTVIKDGIVYPEIENLTREEIDDEILQVTSIIEGIPEECVAVIMEISQVFQNVITDRVV
jgi:hypothetical protein